MAATRPPAKGKGTAETRTRRAAARDADDERPEVSAQKTDAAPRPAIGVFSTTLTVLAGVLLIVGVTLMSMGLYAYENVNIEGTHTVEQQLQMAGTAIYSGAALVSSSLVALGLVAVAVRVARR